MTMARAYADSIEPATLDSIGAKNGDSDCEDTFKVSLGRLATNDLDEGALTEGNGAA